MNRKEIGVEVDRLVAAKAISRGLRSRALELLALVTSEAERHGLTHRSGELRLGAHNYELHLREVTRYVPGKWGNDLEHVGLLEFRFKGPGLPYKDSKMRDAVRTKLEDMVPSLVQRIVYAQPVADERDRVSAERNAEWERERVRREEAAARAKKESEREAALLDAYERWVRTKELREYVSSIRTRAEALHGQAKIEADEWIEWADRYVEKIDPTNDAIAMPNPDPASRWPFLKGLL